MPFDFGYIIAAVLFLWIAAGVYKKRTGRPISELYMGTKSKLRDRELSGYKRVYITRGIKQ